MTRIVPALTLFIAMVVSTVASAYDFQHYGNVGIYSADGTYLSAKMNVPVGAPGEQFPVIIFCNSWALGESEYDLQADLFASQGYVTLSYAARGWYGSGGMINSTGAKDMEDIHALVDYLVAQPEVDANNIGMTGVSLGGGMTLMAAAHEPRIKTVVSFSGWTNILDSMYGGWPDDTANGQGQATLRSAWAGILIFAGDLIGNLDPTVAEMRDRLAGNYELDLVADWAAERSVETFIDEYNNRQIPVYMVNNYQDQLFQPNQMERFFSKLNYDAKRMDVNRGIHITGEIGGFINVGGTLADFMGILGDGPIRNALTGIFGALDIELGDIESNGPWKKAHRWFDHHLKGITVDPDGKEIMAEEKVQLKDKVASGRFKDWVAPQDSTNVTNETYYFDYSRQSIFHPYKTNLKTQTVGNSDYKIYTGKDTDATTGIDLPGNLDGFVDTIVSFLLDDITLTSTLAGLMEAHLDDVHRTANLNDFTKYYMNISCPLGCYREAGVMYETDTFSEAKEFVGAASMDLWIEPQESDVHMVAYVYEIQSGWGAKNRLITHAPVTRRGVVPGQPLQMTFDMVFTKFTTEPGSKIAVVFDTQDPLYQDVNGYNDRIKILHGDGYNSSVTMPFAN